MRLGSSLGLLALLLVVDGTAMAADEVIRLDGTNGKPAVWQVKGVSGSTASFDFTFVATKPGQDVAPTYSIAISDGKGDTLEFLGEYQDGDAPMPTVLIFRGGKEVATAGSPLKFSLNKEYPVSFSWTDYAIMAKADNFTSQYRTGFTPTEITITSTSGVLELKNMTVQTATAK